MPKDLKRIRITPANMNIPAHFEKFRRHYELEQSVFNLSNPITSRSATRFQHSGSPESLYAYYHNSYTMNRTPVYNIPGYVDVNNTTTVISELIWISDTSIPNSYIGSCITLTIRPAVVPTIVHPIIIELWSVLTNPNYKGSGTVGFMILSLFNRVPPLERQFTKCKLGVAKQNFPFIDFYNRLFMYARLGFETLDPGKQITATSNLPIYIGGVDAFPGIFKDAFTSEIPSDRLVFHSKLKNNAHLVITFRGTVWSRIFNPERPEFNPANGIMNDEQRALLFNPPDPAIPPEANIRVLPGYTYTEEEFRKTVTSLVYRSVNDDLFFTTDFIGNYNFQTIVRELGTYRNKPLSVVPTNVPEIQFAYVSHSGVRLNTVGNKSYIHSFRVPEGTEVVVINTPGFGTNVSVLRGSWDATIRYLSRFSIDQIQSLFASMTGTPYGIDVSTDLDYMLNTCTGMLIQLLKPNRTHSSFVQIHSYKAGDMCPDYVTGVYSHMDNVQERPPQEPGQRPHVVYDHAYAMFGLYKIDKNMDLHTAQKWQLNGENPMIETRGPTDATVDYFLPGNPVRYTVDEVKAALRHFGSPNPDYLLFPNNELEHIHVDLLGTRAGNTFNYEVPLSQLIEDRIRPIHQQMENANMLRLAGDPIRIYIYSCGNIINPPPSELRALTRFRFLTETQFTPTMSLNVIDNSYYRTIQRVGESLFDIYKNYLPLQLTPASLLRQPRIQRNIEQHIHELVQTRRMSQADAQDVVRAFVEQRTQAQQELLQNAWAHVIHPIGIEMLERIPIRPMQAYMSVMKYVYNIPENIAIPFVLEQYSQQYMREHPGTTIEQARVLSTAEMQAYRPFTQAENVVINAFFEQVLGRIQLGQPGLGPVKAQSKPRKTRSKRKAKSAKTRSKRKQT